MTTIQNTLLSKDLRKFPILAAASAAIKRCGTCKHRHASPNTLLRAAVLRLQHNPQFIEFMRSFTELPVHIAGIQIG